MTTSTLLLQGQRNESRLPQPYSPFLSQISIIWLPNRKQSNIGVVRSKNTHPIKSNTNISNKGSSHSTSGDDEARTLQSTLLAPGGHGWPML